MKPSETFKASIYFDVVELAPGEEREIVGRVDDGVVLFRGHFVIARESAPGTTIITNLVLATRGGSRRQLPASNGGVASVIFSEAARKLSSGFLFDTHDPALGAACITVRNGADRPVKWSGEIEGVAVGKDAR